MSNNIYNILGKLKALTESAAPTVDTPSETVYENVEARGSISEAVKSLESKYATFKEAKAKPDFLDVDKDGDKKEPFKKAVKDKKQVKEDVGSAKPQRSEFKKPADYYQALAYYYAEQAEKAFGDRSRKFDAMSAEYQEKADSYDLDEGKHDEPEAPNADAVAKRKRLQALKDKQEDERAERGENKPESNVRIHKGTYGNEYKDDADLDEAQLDEYSQAEYDQAMGDFKSKGGKAQQLPPGAAKNPISTASRHIAGRGEAGKGKTAGRGANVSASKPVVDVYEKAPPGAKAERMVKHIKKGYADDGKLTKREKGIAYATAWKAHNKGQVEEGVEFKDAGKIKNSAPDMKKAKPAMVKESRVMEETDYFYEKVAKSLCGKNPNLNTADGEFVDAVRKEMVAQGIEPNRARNIIMMDEDFISDVASSYGHYCKEVAESSNFFHNPDVPDHEQLPAPPEEVNVELDEIAALAGLARVAAPAVASVATDRVMDKVLSEAPGVSVNGKEVNVGSIEVDGVNDWDSPDFADAYITYATFTDGTPLSDDELNQLESEHGDLVNQAAHGSLQDRADFLDEDDVVEGNEFTKARLDAIAQGNDTFTVDGKTYKVSGDVSQERSFKEATSLNDIRRLSGMEEAEEVDEERDIEYVNTPNEKIAPLSAAIPSGTDLHKAKRQDPQTANKAANPLEEGLWKSYEAMIKQVKTK